MSENASTESASEQHQTSADAGDTGSAVKTGSEGTQADGVRSGSEDAVLEARVRSEQGRADRAEAKARELEAKLASLAKPDASSESEVAPVQSGMTPADFHNALQVYGMAGEIKEAYPNADPSVFADLSAYGSAEALRAAAATSHEARSLSEAELKAKVEKELRAKYAERYGELDDEAPPSGGENPTGLPTVAQIRAMSLNEYDKFKQENPGVIESILAANSSDELYTR